MSLQRRVKRIGSSLGVLIPRDLAEALNVKDGSPVRLTLVGRQVVIEPVDNGLRDSMRWYEKNRSRLLRQHPGEYIAIVDRAVIDHDLDFEALARRVFARIGVRPVFMPRVQAGEGGARVRSPRRLPS